MVSIVISHRESSFERQDNLIFLLDYYHDILKDIKHEIIIVEQDVESKVNYITCKNEKHIFIFNDGLYNRSWSMNVGSKYCQYDNILFCDNDIVVPKNEFLFALENLKTVLFPYENFFDMDEEITEKFKSDLDFEYVRNNKHTKVIERYGNEGSGKVVKAGGCFFAKKDFYFDIGGNDENCEGYGAEDDIFYLKIKKIIPHDIIRNYNGEIFHLFHKKMDYVWLRDQSFYKKNCDIMNKMNNMSYEELLNYIKQCKKDWGNINKYCANI